MALKSTAKAEAMSRKLAEDLQIRIKANAAGRVNSVREAKDTNGWPVLFLSRDANEAAGQPVIAIRIKGDSAVSKDIFGNEIIAAAPHTMDLAYEIGQVVKADFVEVLFDAVKLGTKLALKEITAATAVTVSSIDATAATDTHDLLYWPTKSV
jgi:hypothetical protein